ncbi:MAG: hypothetical protein WB471_13045 [Nocardioides sp.]
MTSPHFDPVSRLPEHLVLPRRVDPAGLNGPTRRMASGRYYERVASGLYAPIDRSASVEQRILDSAARLTADGRMGCVTGWAACRLHGAAYFDGLTPDGATTLPVTLAVGAWGHLRSDSRSVVDRSQITDPRHCSVAGVPVAPIQRALFDEIRYRDSLWGAVQAIDMVAAAGLISVWLFARYAGECNSANGAPLLRRAVALAVDESRSPRETWLRLVWILVAAVPWPLVNQPLYDLDGQLLGIPDLFDPVAGMVGEYDGEAHRGVERHRKDVAREARFRDHGLEYFTVVQGDDQRTVARRIRDTRSRAKFLPPESCAWTLTRPVWDPAPPTLDERLERRGLVEELTRAV